jgi:hypothetical protein
VRRVLAGSWKMAEGAQATGVSVRQMRRLCRAVERRGEAAVVHGNRGRPAHNRLGAALERQVVGLYRHKYRGFNDQHFTEKLVGEEGLTVSRASVRRWLRAAGLAAVRKHRPPRHHRRRERKPQAGLMLLWDGSRHDWLEGRGPLLCLVGAIDDATSEFLPGARFVAQECAAAYLAVLRTIAQERGLPWSCYGDRHSIFRRNDDCWTLEEELRGRQDPTQVGRALEALQIERIDALSPQAKGRVERLWGTLQDRLTSELRLRKVRTAGAAEAVLQDYLRDHNRRFAVPAAEAQSAWRAMPPGTDLDRVLSFFYEATVGNDNTVKVGEQVLQIPPGPGGRGYAHARVEVRQLLDGSWRIYHKNKLVALVPATELGELRVTKTKKRPIASRVFRHLVLRA